MKDRLEDYYKQKFYCDGMPDFNSLNSEEKRQIRGTYGFAFYNAQQALNECKETIKKSLGVN